MTINDVLFKAILSMDSYNRGYGAGIKLGTEEDITTIGGALVVQQSDTGEKNQRGQIRLKRFCPVHHGFIRVYSCPFVA